jgi:hypothetical protein
MSSGYSVYSDYGTVEPDVSILKFPLRHENPTAPRMNKITATENSLHHRYPYSVPVLQGPVNLDIVKKNQLRQHSPSYSDYKQGNPHLYSSNIIPFGQYHYPLVPKEINQKFFEEMQADEQVYPILNPVLRLKKLAVYIGKFEDFINRNYQKQNRRDILCPTCIRKNFVTLYAILDEARTLECSSFLANRTQTNLQFAENTFTDAMYQNDYSLAPYEQLLKNLEMIRIVLQKL